MNIYRRMTSLQRMDIDMSYDEMDAASEIIKDWLEYRSPYGGGYINIRREDICAVYEDKSHGTTVICLRNQQKFEVTTSYEDVMKEV